MLKKILVVHYSQSGQLDRVTRSMLAPLEESEGFDVVYEPLQPVKPFPFPWPFFRFFDTFPETVYDQPCPLAPLVNDYSQQDFDLVILAYQVWFLSPSQPMAAFLQSPEAAKVLRDRPVMTLIVCRNMWLMAQEKVKNKVAELGGRLIDNAVLTDSAHSAATFISTPLWVLTGNKGPFLGGRIPAAGVSTKDITAARRFGEALRVQLPTREIGDYSPMLTGLGAVQINERLIASEQVAHRSFRIWGALLRRLGTPGSLLRRVVLVLYIAFLVSLILTVVPVLAIIKRCIAPLTREKIRAQRAYYAAPSGDDASRWSAQ